MPKKASLPSLLLAAILTIRVPTDNLRCRQRKGFQLRLHVNICINHARTCLEFDSTFCDWVDALPNLNDLKVGLGRKRSDIETILQTTKI